MWMRESAENTRPTPRRALCRVCRNKLGILPHASFTHRPRSQRYWTQSNRIDCHLSAKLSAIFDLTQVPSPPMGRVPAVRKKAVPERASVCHARISYLHASPHALPAGRFRLW